MSSKVRENHHMHAGTSARGRGKTWLALPVSLALTLGFAGTASADEVVNDGTLDGSAPCASAPDHTSVQAGVTAASVGETVVVCPGTYTGQVVIDKNVTVDGFGPGVSNLVAPSSVSSQFQTSDGQGGVLENRPVVHVEGATSAVISDLTIDGNGVGNANHRLIGVAFEDAGGTVRDSEIVDVRNTPLDGMQAGVGVYALNFSNAARSIDILDNDITGYQKNGVSLNGDDLTVDVRGNLVDGAGATNQIAQNGIQVGWETSGTIADNEVSDHKCTHATCGANGFWSAGIILFGDSSSNIAVTGNEISGNDAGVLASSDQASSNPTTTVEGNSIAASTFAGVYVDDGTLNAVSNVVTGGVSGLLAYSYDDTTDWVPTLNASGNTLDGMPFGINSDEVGGANVQGPNITARFNSMVGNPGKAVANVTERTVDAENNWYGSNSGPGTQVTGGVDADPHLVFGLSANPQSIQTGGATSQVTASVAQNSAGQTPAGNNFPSRAIDLSTDLGSVTDTNVANGSGTATLTSGATAGTATVSGQLNGQSASTQVAFQEPAPADTGGGDTGGQQQQDGGATQAADHLIGTAADDVIEGLDGDDTILGGLGDDLLSGGNGADVLKGGLGDDEVSGGNGPDEVNGGNGNDTIRGGAGPDTLDGGGGEDDISGGRGQDDITANDGEKDTINCGANVDAVKADGKDDVSSNCENVS
jgi:hypothetical protein